MLAPLLAQQQQQQQAPAARSGSGSGSSAMDGTASSATPTSLPPLPAHGGVPTSAAMSVSAPHVGFPSGAATLRQSSPSPAPLAAAVAQSQPPPPSPRLQARHADGSVAAASPLLVSSVSGGELAAAAGQDVTPEYEVLQPPLDDVQFLPHSSHAEAPRANDALTAASVSMQHDHWTASSASSAVHSALYAPASATSHQATGGGASAVSYPRGPTPMLLRRPDAYPTPDPAPIQHPPAPAHRPSGAPAAVRRPKSSQYRGVS
ncbi:hypothetical protein EON68_05015 [archaeon]|nr:MAG: hypothetical protein EON68_05015 [archaeon]